MEDNKDFITDESSINFDVIIKNQKDIIDDMCFESEKDKNLCFDIIKNLEETAAKCIKERKVVQLPYVGCLRINPIVAELKQNKQFFSTIRTNISKEQYKNHVSSFVVDIREKQKHKDFIKTYLFKLRNKNKKKYDDYYKRFGRAYANMFIFAIFNLKEVPFDYEWEMHYQSLKD